MTTLPQSYKGKYDPASPKAYQISRSKIEQFGQCARCFYLDRRLKVGQPQGPPFTLNSAVDTLLKAEFDTHRAAGKPHSIQTEYGIDAVPAPHEQLDKWRENFHGIRYYDPETNFLLFGAIDDLWINPAGEYIVVDYKATAKTEPVTELGDAPWHDAYRRQIEFYQWLLRRNDLKVSNTGYWVYCTGDPHNKAFDKKLEFRVHLIAYEGDDSWVGDAIKRAHVCLNSDKLPSPAPDCEFCAYFAGRTAAER